MVVSRPYQADRAEKGPKKMSDKTKKEREEDEIRSEQSEFQHFQLWIYDGFGLCFSPPQYQIPFSAEIKGYWGPKI